MTSSIRSIRLALGHRASDHAGAVLLYTLTDTYLTCRRLVAVCLSSHSHPPGHSLHHSRSPRRHRSTPRSRDGTPSWRPRRVRLGMLVYTTLVGAEQDRGMAIAAQNIHSSRSHFAFLHTRSRRGHEWPNMLPARPPTTCVRPCSWRASRPHTRCIGSST